MPAFKDDIAATGGTDDVRKEISHCIKMEIEKKT